MEQSKLLRLLITTGDDEEVLAVLTQERHPNEFGDITPPIIVDFEDQEYILRRKFMHNVYMYAPSDRKLIDDFLAPNPIK